MLSCQAVLQWFILNWVVDGNSIGLTELITCQINPVAVFEDNEEEVAAGDIPHHEDLPQPGHVEPGVAAAPAAAAEARDVAVPAEAAAAEDVPWDVLFPKKSRFREAIVTYALPHLLPLLRNPENRLKSSRDLVGQALDSCERAGNTFWGKYDVYSRKRSACDAIIIHYFDTLHDYALGRRVVPL